MYTEGQIELFEEHIEQLELVYGFSFLDSFQTGLRMETYNTPEAQQARARLEGFGAYTMEAIAALLKAGY